MAESEEQQDQANQDKTIGKQADEATNGAATEDELREKAEQAADDIAGAYADARRELNESMNRLRYEMAQFDAAQARARARTWVEENPVLAAFLAVGAGIVVGKLIAKAVRPAPPPTLGERLRQQSRSLASRAQHVAHDLGDVVAARASEAGEGLARRASKASASVSRHARDLGDIVAQRAEEIADEAADQVGALGDTLSEQSHDAGRALRRQAAEAADSIKSSADQGISWAESGLNAAKTVAAAYVVKRFADWIRKAA